MSRLDRGLGVVRSLATYHGIPFRQRRLRALYRLFVSNGDLAFDVGAHAGNRVRALRALGCRVVAIEPQPDFARVLRCLFGRSPDVQIVEMAVADRAGRMTLQVSERRPTVSTLAPAWREARARDADFSGVRWNRSLEVEVTTLDALAGRFGRPRFIKIDVEGAEYEVLRGAEATLKKHRPIVLSELSAALLQSNGSSAAAVIEFMRRLAYRIVDPLHPGRRFVARDYGDMLCLPDAAD